MTKRTFHKIQEARYFLAELQKAKHLNMFSFYLSAFLNAARSITWVLQSELPCKKPYEDAKSKLSSAQKELLNLFVEKRNVVTKEGNLTLNQTFFAHQKVDVPAGSTIRIVGTIDEFLNGSAKAENLTTPSHIVEPQVVELKTTFYFPSDMVTPIPELCRHYLVLVEDLVNEVSEACKDAQMGTNPFK